MSSTSNEPVILYASTAVLPRAVAVPLPADLGIDEAFRRIVSARGDDEEGRRTLGLIERELHGQVTYLSVAPGRPAEVVPPATPLGDIAVPGEAVDDGEEGIHPGRAVFVEAQAHARVG